MDGIRLGCPPCRHLPQLLAWEVRRKSRGARTAWIFSFRRCQKFWIQDDHKFHRKVKYHEQILEYWCIYCKHRCVFVLLCFCVFLSTCSWCVQYVQIRLRTSRLRWEIDALIAMELGGSTENGGNLPRSYQPVGMPGLWRSTSNLRYGVFLGCWLSLFESLVFNLWVVFPFCLDQFRRKCISRVALGKNSTKTDTTISTISSVIRWSLSPLTGPGPWLKKISFCQQGILPSDLFGGGFIRDLYVGDQSRGHCEEAGFVAVSTACAWMSRTGSAGKTLVLGSVG